MNKKTELSPEIQLGPAYEKSTGMGPVVNDGHMKFVTDWIETGVKEGAELIFDGRNPEVPAGYEKGFFIGPTIFDHVTEEMSVDREEIFGPVKLGNWGRTKVERRQLRRELKNKAIFRP